MDSSLTSNYRLKQLESESPGLVVMGGDSHKEVVGSNPGTGYWMDLFTYIAVKILMFV